MTDLPDILARATPEQLAEALIEAMETLDDVADSAKWIASEIRLGPNDEGREVLEAAEAIAAEARATLSRINAIMNPKEG